MSSLNIQNAVFKREQGTESTLEANSIALEIEPITTVIELDGLQSLNYYILGAMPYLLMVDVTMASGTNSTTSADKVKFNILFNRGTYFRYESSHNNPHVVQFFADSTGNKSLWFQQYSTTVGAVMNGKATLVELPIPYFEATTPLTERNFLIEADTLSFGNSSSTKTKGETVASLDAEGTFRADDIIFSKEAVGNYTTGGRFMDYGPAVGTLTLGKNDDFWEGDGNILTSTTRTASLPLNISGLAAIYITLDSSFSVTYDQNGTSGDTTFTFDEGIYIVNEGISTILPTTNWSTEITDQFTMELIDNNLTLKYSSKNNTLEPAKDIVVKWAPLAYK